MGYASVVQAPEFTMLLHQWSGGDESALAALMPVVYGELHRLAAARLRNERSEHTLQPTALIHEAYLKLVDQNQRQWQSRAHFFSVASRIMREILVDNARKHRAAKRGKGIKVPLDDAISATSERGRSLENLDEALRELSRVDERKSRLIEMRYFGGLSGEEVAEVLGISISTITREMRMAEAWIESYLGRSSSRARGA
jgi:RNA polymerase sigma factor (TIGR02999 family)